MIPQVLAFLQLCDLPFASHCTLPAVVPAKTHVSQDRAKICKGQMFQPRTLLAQPCRFVFTEKYQLHQRSESEDQERECTLVVLHLVDT